MYIIIINIPPVCFRGLNQRKSWARLRIGSAWQPPCHEMTSRLLTLLHCHQLPVGARGGAVVLRRQRWSWQHPGTNSLWVPMAVQSSWGDRDGHGSTLAHPVQPFSGSHGGRCFRLLWTSDYLVFILAGNGVLFSCAFSSDWSTVISQVMLIFSGCSFRRF